MQALRQAQQLTRWALDVPREKLAQPTTMTTQVGPLYWPVRQICEEGRNLWTEVPRPGQKLSDLKAPAAQLEVLSAGSLNEHQH